MGTHFNKMLFFAISLLNYTTCNALVESAYGTYGVGRFPYLEGNLNQDEVFPYTQTGDIMPEMYFGKRSAIPLSDWNSLLGSEFQALLKWNLKHPFQQRNHRQHD